MNRKRTWISALIALGAAWALQFHAPEGRASRVVPAPPAGMVVHVDPVTGEFVAPGDGTVPVTLDKEMLNALSTSAEGLVETPSPVPGGGVMVDLRGRFQSTHIAVVDGDGRFSAACYSGAPHTHADGDTCAARADATSAEARP